MSDKNYPPAPKRADFKSDAEYRRAYEAYLQACQAIAFWSKWMPHDDPALTARPERNE